MQGLGQECLTNFIRSLAARAISLWHLHHTGASHCAISLVQSTDGNRKQAISKLTKLKTLVLAMLVCVLNQRPQPLNLQALPTQRRQNAKPHDATRHTLNYKTLMQFKSSAALTSRAA